ncbi:hypothetical protein [Anaplasma bovis]|uniref:hypothetical protein n=1 Tax=Anaplasma bovis TaxID=186733 RepID=UPI002FEEA289
MLGLVAKAALNFAEVSVISTSAEKPYRTFSSNTESLGYKLGATILRPIVESRIDKYLKDQGMEEYLLELKSRAFPVSDFSFIDVESGEGPEAMCGQEVSAIVISVPVSDVMSGSTSILKAASKQLLGKLPASAIKESINPSKMPFSGEVVPSTLKIGTHEIAEVNYSLAGMRKNGSRVVTVTDSDGNAVSHHYISVKSINNTGYPTNAMKGFMIFDKGNNSPKKDPITIARCGDKVSVTYKIRDLNGDLVTQGKTGEFTIGAREMPLAFDLGAVDLRSDVARSIIVPPEFFKGFNVGGAHYKGVSILDLQIARSTQE